MEFLWVIFKRGFLKMFYGSLRTIFNNSSIFINFSFSKLRRRFWNKPKIKQNKLPIVKSLTQYFFGKNTTNEVFIKTRKVTGNEANNSDYNFYRNCYVSAYSWQN